MIGGQSKLLQLLEIVPMHFSQNESTLLYYNPNNHEVPKEASGAASGSFGPSPQYSSAPSMYSEPFAPTHDIPHEDITQKKSGWRVSPRCPKWEFHHWVIWIIAVCLFLGLAITQVILWKFLVFDEFANTYDVRNGTFNFKWVDVAQNAKGFIAIGQFSVGFIAIGQFARGVFTIGQLSVGIINISMIGIGLIFSFGLIQVSMGPAGYLIGSSGYSIFSLVGVGFIQSRASLLGVQCVSPFFHDVEGDEVTGSTPGHLISSKARAKSGFLWSPNSVVVSNLPQSYYTN